MLIYPDIARLLAEERLLAAERRSRVRLRPRPERRTVRSETERR